MTSLTDGKFLNLHSQLVNPVHLVMSYFYLYKGKFDSTILSIVYKGLGLD